MNTEMVSLDKLIAAPYNPRTISQHEFESLQRSLDEFGVVEPAVVNKRNMTIVGGHMRVNAARALGLKEFPVVWVDLDIGREKALNIALNKISGEFDNDLLAEVLHDLEPIDFDLTGFTMEEAESIQDGPIEHDENGPKEPGVKRWSLDELKIERDKYLDKTGLDDGGFVDFLANS